MKNTTGKKWISKKLLILSFAVITLLALTAFIKNGSTCPDGSNSISISEEKQEIMHVLMPGSLNGFFITESGY